ncbi:MAG: XRE family transcriptional regulator [Oscillospiraceae bacterium]|jgi:hypothetical protein|nr:XRE family transcriptional regulator [Oscillospiraceae bacterium]
MGKKKPLCELGQKIEIALIKLNRPNTWLIARVTEDTGLYFDRSYLHKVKTGQIATPSIVESICKILKIKDENGGT